MTQVEKLKESLLALVESLAVTITKREDEVFVYVGNNSYVLDQDGLRKVLREAILGKDTNDYTN